MNFGLAVLAVGGRGDWLSSELDPEILRTLAFVYGFLLLLGLLANLVLGLRLASIPQRWPARQARVVRRLLPSSTLLTYFLFLFFCFVLGILLQMLMAVAPGAIRRVVSSDGVFLVVHSLLFHWAALAGLAWVLAGGRRGWVAVFGGGRRRVGRDLILGAFGYVAMVPFVLFFAAIYMRALHGLGYDMKLQEVALTITGETSTMTRFYLYFMAIVLAPVVEELLFRGIGFPWLMKRLGPATAMLTISILFSAIHFHVPGFVPLFVVSVALCFAYVHTGSIVVPIVMHAFFNGINLWAMTYLAGHGL